MPLPPPARLRLPLNWILLTPFLVQIVAVVGVTGWLSYRSGQRAVANLATGLLVQAKARISGHLDQLLTQAELIVQANAYALEQQQISLQQPEALQAYFEQQLRRKQPTPQAIYAADPEGRYLLVDDRQQLEWITDPTNLTRSIFAIDALGKRGKPIGQSAYDPRQRPWYQAAIAAKGPIWTPIYPFASGGAGITTAQAVRDATGRLLSVTAVDLELQDLDRFLGSIRLSRASQVFIFETSGFLVANSTTASSLKKLANPHGVPPQAQTVQRILATESTSVPIRESARFLQAEAGTFDALQSTLTYEVMIQNERHFLSVQPYRFGQSGVEWLVAIVVPERDFTQQLEENRRSTLLLCVMALFLAIAVGYLTAKSITRTLARLTQAADTVIEGEWPVANLEGGESQEMSALVQSFDRMVAHLKMTFGELENFAYQDSLTGLYNRAGFLSHLEYAIATAQKVSPPSFALLLLNIDGFKLIENGLGHGTAELLLKSVGERLQALLPNPGAQQIYLARIERDEFAILVSGDLTDQKILAIAEQILQGFQQPFHLGLRDVLVTACIGLVIDRGDRKHPQELLHDAHLAKLSAKDQGKGTYTVFDGLMRQAATERLQLEADLQQAIARDELELWYQPIIDAEQNQIEGFEALVRWRHPEAGLIPPGKFIPLAEANGTILDMGQWILQTACHQMKQWQQTYPAFATAFMSVNVSAQQLLLPDFTAQIAQILRETGLEGRYLQIEITESAAVSQPRAIAAKFKYLQSLGVLICIDDFGTGYSHLSYLADLPINGLKIDRSFVDHLGASATSRELTHTILCLARGLNLEATAEGVETAVQLEELRELGCLSFQGYFFSRPIPAGDVPNLYTIISPSQQR